MSTSKGYSSETSTNKPYIAASRNLPSASTSKGDITIPASATAASSATVAVPKHKNSELPSNSLTTDEAIMDTMLHKEQVSKRRKKRYSKKRSNKDTTVDECPSPLHSFAMNTKSANKPNAAKKDNRVWKMCKNKDTTAQVRPSPPNPVTMTSAAVHNKRHYGSHNTAATVPVYSLYQHFLTGMEAMSIKVDRQQNPTQIKKRIWHNKNHTTVEAQLEHQFAEEHAQANSAHPLSTSEEQETGTSHLMNLLRNAMAEKANIEMKTSKNMLHMQEKGMKNEKSDSPVCSPVVIKDKKEHKNNTDRIQLTSGFEVNEQVLLPDDDGYQFIDMVKLEQNKKTSETVSDLIFGDEVKEQLADSDQYTCTASTEVQNETEQTGASATSVIHNNFSGETPSKLPIIKTEIIDEFSARFRVPATPKSESTVWFVYKAWDDVKKELNSSVPGMGKVQYFKC